MADSRFPPRFLNFLAQPSDRILCGLLSLHTACTLVLACDIVLALLYTLESLLLILLNGLIASKFFEVTVTLIGNCTSILALPFAIVGLVGLRQDDVDKFHVYFLYKCFETFFISIYSPATSFLYCSDSSYTCGVITLLVVLCQKVAVDIYCTYIVWSADYQMKSGAMQQLTQGKNVEMIPISKDAESIDN